MKITILTLFPEIFTGFCNTSIIKRAIEKKQVEIELVNIRDFSLEKHHHVDDTPYGGGPGMVMRVQPVIDALKSVYTPNSKVFITAPSGIVFNQKVAHDFVKIEHLILICGRYEGFDARIYDYVDGLISIGDYVLTGGEIAAMAISDAVIRLIDGVIVAESYQDESFENGLLEYPHYTKPAVYDGKKVPEVLLSGHHKNIEQWRLKESLKSTYLKRKDLLENRKFSKEERILLDEIIEEESTRN